MTDRFHSLTVVLAHDMREDDAQALMSAIQMLKGVLTVKGNVADLNSMMAETRARSEIGEKLWAVLHAKDRAE